MIKDTTAERIDDLIERFETGWSATSIETIQGLMGEADLLDDDEAVTELVRIDIEHRYREGLPVPLDDYWSRFELLRGNPRRASEVVFEDHRSRQAFGYPFEPDRWANIDGIEGESWYQDYVEGQEVLSRAFELPAPVGAEVLWSGVEISARPPGWFDLSQPLIDGLEQIGFRLRELIGTGAFAKVFLATQKSLAYREVVLKIVEDAWSEPEQLAKLQHTNIVPIYSVHRVKAHTVICMPYAGRWTLEKFMRHTQSTRERDGHTLVRTLLSEPKETCLDDAGSVRAVDSANESQPTERANPVDQEAVGVDSGVSEGANKLPFGHAEGPLAALHEFSHERLTVWIFRRIAAGLSHSHERGLLHQDLKPANVLIRDDGEPALLDFNLAVATDRSDQQRLGGTPAYMSPEALRQYLGDDEPIGQPADIYGLGCMMYEFATGRRPYPAPDEHDKKSLRVLLEQRQKRVSWRGDDPVSLGVRRVIERCLDPDPAGRYSSSRQLLEDLSREESGQALRHAPQPWIEGMQKRIRRHPRWATGLLIGGLAFLAAIPIITQNRTVKAESELVKSQTKFDRFTEESEQALSAALVNPSRYGDDAVNAALVPLQTFGVLSGSFDEQLLDVEGLASEQRIARRDLALRHVVFAAITEAERIEAAHGEDLVAEDELERMSRLVATAKRLTPENDNRSVWQIEADLAGFRGDGDSQTQLLTKVQGTDPQSSNEKYLDAVRHLKDRSFQEASKLLRELEDDPTIPNGSRWTLLGRSEYADREFESAKLAFTSSMRYSSDSARLRFLRGRTYHFAGQFRRAIADYIQALQWEPDFSVARWNLAKSWMELDEPENAAEVLDEGLERQPNNIPMLALRSEALSKSDRSDAAKSDYQKALDQDAVTYRDFFYRGRLRRKNRDYDGAIQDLLRAEDMVRTSSEAKYELATAILKRGDLRGAVAKMREAHQLYPNNERTMIDLAVLLARDGKFAEADELKEKALQGRNHAVVLYQAACVDALKPDFESHQIAVSRLARAVNSGYGAVAMLTDPDLASIRPLRGYKMLRGVKEIERRVED